ncbi:MAG: hypothetical protein KBB79_05185 [Candidatus Omnitrophica bacterium]|nr:hypothetical protein [Candidatus Omnitrophota bacterium]
MGRTSKTLIATMIVVGFILPGTYAEKKEGKGQDKGKASSKMEEQLTSEAKKALKDQKKQALEAYKQAKKRAMDAFKEANKAAKQLKGEERTAAMKKAVDDKNAALKAAADAKKTALDQIKAAESGL